MLCLISYSLPHRQLRIVCTQGPLQPPSLQALFPLLFLTDLLTWPASAARSWLTVIVATARELQLLTQSSRTFYSLVPAFPFVKTCTLSSCERNDLFPPFFDWTRPAMVSALLTAHRADSLHPSSEMIQALTSFLGWWIPVSPAFPMAR